MHDFEVGRGVKEEKAAEWAEAARPGLVEGEEIIGIFKGAPMKENADITIITTARLLFVATMLGSFEFKREHRIGDVAVVAANKMGMNGSVAVTKHNGDKVKFSVGSVLGAKADAAAAAAAIERARTHPQHAASTANLHPPDPNAKPDHPTSAPPKVKPRVDTKGTTVRRRRRSYGHLASFRFWFSVVFFTGIPALIVGAFVPALMWPVWFGLAGVWVWASIVEGGPNPYQCPHCGQGIKMAVPVCSRCGRDTGF